MVTELQHTDLHISNFQVDVETLRLSSRGKVQRAFLLLLECSMLKEPERPCSSSERNMKQKRDLEVLFMFSSAPVFPSKNFVPFTFTPHIQYGEADGVPLLLDMLCPSPLPSHHLPAVIYIFGGGWEGGHRSAGMYPWLSPLLATQGFLTVNISYRMSYQAVFPAQIHDAKAAVRWLRANAEHYHINPDRIGAWGFSSGGHLASLLGVTGDLPTLEGECGSPGYSSRVQAVVAAAAPSNFLHPGGQLLNDGPSNEVIRLFGGTVREHEEQMRLGSPISHVNADASPFFLIHGTRDEVVPFEQTEQMYEALKAVGVEVTFLVTEWGHDWDTGWYEVALQYLAFFQRHLCG